MKKIAAAVLALSFAQSAFAGSTNIELQCVSDSGRTQLTAWIPGDEAEHNVTFTIDGKSLNWFDHIVQTPPYPQEKNSNIVVSGRARQGDLKFQLLPKDKEGAVLFSFQELAGTQNIKKTYSGERGRLRAKVMGVDPRYAEQGTQSKVIEVLCEYRYEL
ncbi:MAG: hypothetical protein WC728_01010 [Elusimicrobiota bacterium]